MHHGHSFAFFFTPGTVDTCPGMSSSGECGERDSRQCDQCLRDAGTRVGCLDIDCEELEPVPRSQIGAAAYRETYDTV